MEVEFAAVPGFFVTGGTMPPGSPSYIERVADKELFDALIAGEYSHVLNARQMGKSSLAIRTFAKLKASGVRTAFVDLTAFGGATSSSEQWYAGLLVETGRALDLRASAVQYLQSQRALAPARRFLAFLRDQVLLEVSGPIVVMIDEIDAVRSLPFPTDELFAGIRQLHNGRASDPELKRLTFCLLGAALPSDLIRDPRTTPFNIGRRIELKDFSIAEVKALETGIASPRASETLERIHYWTGGHPFLTQGLCAEIASSPEAEVDSVVKARYLQARSRESDTNLADVANRLLRRGDPEADEKSVSTILTLYLAVLKRGIPYDETNPACAKIKMSGVTRLQGSRLAVRNRIYGAAFDKKWVQANMPQQEARRQRRAYWLGVARASAIACVVIALVGASALIAYKEKVVAQAAETHAKLSAADAIRESARAGKSESLMREAEKRAEAHATAEGELRAEAQKAGELADRRATEALNAKAAASRSALLAQKNEAEARRLLYDSNMALAGHAVADGSGAQIESLLTGSGTALLRGWEYEHYQAVIHEATELPGQNAECQKLAFSPRGRLLVKLAPNILQVWDLAAGRLIRQDSPKDHLGGLDCDLAKGGSRAIVTSSRGQVEILSPEDLSSASTVQCSESPIFEPKLADSGNLVACTVGDLQRTLDLKTGKIAPPRRLTTGPWPHVLLPDGDVIEGTNGAILRWRTSEPAKNGILWYACGKQGTNVWEASADGSVAAFSDNNGSLQLVSALDGQRLCPPVSQSAPVTAICFSPDDDFVAIGSMDGVIYIRRVVDGNLIRVLQTRRSRISALAFAADGRVAYGTASGQIGVFHPFSFASPAGSVRPGWSPITSMTLSPDRKQVAVSVLGRGETILDTVTGRQIATFGTNEWASVASFSPDGKQLAVSMYEPNTKRSIFVWDLAKQRNHRFDVIPGDCQGIPKFTQDGKHILMTNGTAYYGTDSKSPIVEYDARSGKEARRSAVEDGGVGCLESSPNGRLLLVGRDAAQSQILDEQTLQVTRVLNAEPSKQRQSTPLDFDESRYVCSGCFSPDGRWALLGRANGRVEVYDVASGKLEASWLAHTGRVMGAMFTRNGRTFMTVSDDHRFRMWSPGQWRSVGEERFSDELQSLAISNTDNSVYIGDVLGTVYARRTGRAFGEQAPSMPMRKKASACRWDEIVAQSKQNGKPILALLTDAVDRRQQFLRAVLSDRTIRTVVARHFTLLSLWPDDLVDFQGRSVLPTVLYDTLFDRGTQFPSMRVIGSADLPSAIRYDAKRAVRIELPTDADAAEIFIRRCRQSSHSFTNADETVIRERFKAIFAQRQDNTSLLRAVATIKKRFEGKIDKGDLLGALEDANRMIEMNPADPDAYDARARAYGGMGRWGVSRADFARSEGLVRPRYNGWYESVQAELLIEGKVDEFRKRFQTILRNRNEMFYDMDRAWVECEGYALDTGDGIDPAANAKRIEHLYSSYFAEPHSGTLRIQLGLIQMRAGRLADAERTIRNALVDTPDWRDGDVWKEMWRMALALVLAHRGDGTGARREFDRAETVTGRKTDGQLISGCGPSPLGGTYLTSSYAVIRRETAALLRH